MMRFFGYLVLNLLLLGISPVATVVLFSALGKGPASYVFLNDQRSSRYIFGAVGACLALVIYLGDLCLPSTHEDGRKGILPRLFPTMLAKALATLMCICLMCAWVFSIGTFPSAPLLTAQLLLHCLVLFMASNSPCPSAAGQPSFVARTVSELMPTTRSESFNIAQVCALIFHAVWTLFLWVFWVGNNGVGDGANMWDDATRSKLEVKGINVERFGSSVRNVKLYLWMAPLISSMGLWLAAVVVMCVGGLQRSLRRDGGNRLPFTKSSSNLPSGEASVATVQLSPQEEAKIGTLVFTIKILTAALVTLCGCLWITASIVGSSLSLASTVQAFTIVFAGFLVVYIYIALSGENRDLLQRGASASPLMKSARGMIESDWAKAILLGMIFIPLPLYLALSFLNQLVRRCRGTATRSLVKVQPDVTASDLKEDDRASAEDATVAPADCTPGWLTDRVAQQMRQLGAWKWTTVHKNLQQLCMLAVCLQVVGGMGTNIFLAWVNAKLEGEGFTTLSAMFFLVGTGMFMIPIVPGIAVYLFGGILIPAGYVRHSGTPKDYSHDTFWIGFGIACLLNFTLKMVAIVLQQKGIGEPMSTNLYVLQTVGANTPQMKAVERILKKPGLNFPKVTILCGGPDWPTSVLTGILRLSLPQMLLGSVPVLINVIFVSAAGTFRLRQAESETWSAMSSVALTVASVWTVLQMALAGYFIQETWEKYHTELSKPRKEHVALDWLGLVEAEQLLYRDSVTQWGVLPLLVRGATFAASLLMLVSTFYMILLQSRCWDNFEVTDDLATLGLHFIRNEGWAAIGVFLSSCLLHAAVQTYTWCTTRGECKNIKETMQPKKNDWIEHRQAQCEEQHVAQKDVDPEDMHRLESELEGTKKELRELRELLEKRGVLDHIMPAVPPCGASQPYPCASHGLGTVSLPVDGGLSRGWSMATGTVAGQSHALGETTSSLADQSSHPI